MTYQHRGTSGLAVASLVLSLVGVSLLAVIFGHIGLNDTRRHGRDGAGMAIAGLVLGYIGIAFWVILWLAVIGAASADVPYDHTDLSDFCTTYPGSC